MTMAYAEFETIPPHSRIEGRPFDPAIVKWVSPASPPPMGTKIRIGFNQLGTGVVKGYFIEENFLGLLVQLDDAPEWYRQQNGAGRLAHIFGPEFKLEPTEREYTFDTRLYAAIRVKAKSKAEAEVLLRQNIDCCDCNFGAWPNGDPILAEASMDDDHPDLIEIDGEPV